MEVEENMDNMVSTRLAMRIHVDRDYNATAAVDACDVHVVSDAYQVRDVAAREAARVLGVPLEDLTFDHYYEFDGGPPWVTRGWRYQKPMTWPQIVESLTR